VTKPEHDQLPNFNTLSVLIGTILTAYSLTHFVQLPTLELDFQLLGVYLSLRLNFPILVSLLVAGLVASGTSWILQFHPKIDQERYTVSHWLLPGLTSLVLMLILDQIPFGFWWWAGAFLSGLILMLVLLAEYIAVDPNHHYYLLAEVGITSLSLALFLMLTIALHAEEVRLFYRVPLLSVAAGLVILRVLHLRTRGRWVMVPTGVTVLLIGELSAGLHYWPINSISFGIALLGPLYALIDMGETYTKNNAPTLKEMFFMPALVMIMSWLVAFFI